MRLAPSTEELQARLGEAWPVSGAVDCHGHVFERGFPLAAARAFDPPPYPLEYYLAWLDALGIRRCVLVNASCYGFDNSVTAYAIDECRASGVAARGVAIIHPEIEELELARLARAGFVGARLMTSRIGGLGTGAFEALARRCALHRWHLEIGVDACEEWTALEPRLAASPVPVVFEYLGKTESEAGLRAVLRLLERRQDFTVKLCEVSPFLKRLAAELPGQLMWGSKLAHDDLENIAAALEWLPDALLRRRVFSENAERFYGL